LKRFSPAAVLVAATLFVVLIDAAIVVVPQTLADPQPSATASTRPLAAAAPATVNPSIDPSADPWWPAPTVDLATPSPTPVPPTPTPTAKPTPVPTMRDTVWNARTYVLNRVGSKGYDCINAIWTAESKWNPQAGNPISGAYGIPQAFPGSKMAAFGSNWQYSPLTQVKWGLWYVNSRYGSACGAYDFWQAHGWY
jgi:hypothetical protein